MMRDRLVTVIGGSGFVGRYVVQALLREGARVRVAVRHPKHAFFLKGGANLGQIQFCAVDVTRPDTLAAALAGADAVVNLAGSFTEMEAVQAEGASHVAEAARAAGITTLVHLSAIGADAESQARYGRSKAAGEAAIRSVLPGATILRPSIIFGREDQFVNRFAAMARMAPVFPVIKADAQFQPVYVGDVARAVLAALADSGQYGGKTFSLGGPKRLTMRGLIDWICTETGQKPFIVEVPDIAAKALALCTGWLPMAPITHDQWLMLQSDNIVGEGEDGLESFDITPTALDAVAPGWMVQYRRHGRFSAKADAA